MVACWDKEVGIIIIGDFNFPEIIWSTFANTNQTSLFDNMLCSLSQ